jgi:hypothetical protein
MLNNEENTLQMIDLLDFYGFENRDENDVLMPPEFAKQK